MSCRDCRRGFVKDQPGRLSNSLHAQKTPKTVNNQEPGLTREFDFRHCVLGMDRAPGQIVLRRSTRAQTRTSRSRVRRFDDVPAFGLVVGIAAVWARRVGHLLAIPLLPAPAAASSVHDACSAAAAARVDGHGVLRILVAQSLP